MIIKCCTLLYFWHPGIKLKLVYKCNLNINFVLWTKLSKSHSSDKNIKNRSTKNRYIYKINLVISGI